MCIKCYFLLNLEAFYIIWSFSSFSMGLKWHLLIIIIPFLLELFTFLNFFTLILRKYNFNLFIFKFTEYFFFFTISFLLNPSSILLILVAVFSTERYYLNMKCPCPFKRSMGNKWSPEWICIIGINTAMSRTPMPQTHWNGKTFPSKAQKNGKLFPWSK